MNKTNSSQEFWQDILQLNPAKNTALYIQLADRIRFFIQEKKLNPGDKLPVSREIQRISGLSSITVENGISILVKEGWLTRRPHYGTFVVDKGSVEASAGKKRTRPVRVVFNQIYPYGEYWFRLLLGLETVLRRNNFHMELWQMSEEFQFEPRELKEGCCALIFCGTCPTDLVCRIAEERFPLLLLGSFDHPRNQQIPNVDMLIHNNRENAYLAMKHLLDLGHRNIGCITAPEGTELHMDYMTGIREAAAEYRLDREKLHIISLPVASAAAGDEVIRRLLCNHTDITAVFSTDPMLACGIRNGVTGLGLHIPEEISLIALGENASFNFHPEITTVTEYPGQMNFVEKAVEILRDQLENPNHAYRLSLHGKAELVVRESTRFLNRHASGKMSAVRDSEQQLLQTMAGV